MEVKITIEERADGYFVAKGEGCVKAGSTAEEARQNLLGMIRFSNVVRTTEEVVDLDSGVVVKQVELSGGLEQSVKAGEIDNEYGGQDVPNDDVSAEVKSEADLTKSPDDRVDSSSPTSAS